jgi:hypothetical protein
MKKNTIIDNGEYKMKLPIYVVFFLMACSSEPNLYSPLVQKSEKETFDVLLSLAEVAFDNGQADKVIEYGEKAIALDPLSEKTAMLLGFSYLGKGGLSIDRALDSIKNPSEEGGQIGQFKNMIPLDPEDYSYLGTKKEDDPALPLVVPYCADRAREGLGKLFWIQKTIRLVCPFIHEDLHQKNDGRHRCATINSTQNYESQHHLIWILAHLSESLIFHSVLTYGTSKQTNFELRVEKLKQLDLKDPNMIPVFLDSMNAVNETMDAIFPQGLICSTTMPDSQFIAMVKDLNTVSATLLFMTGLPSSMTEKLKKALESLDEVSDKAEEVEKLQAQAAKMKADATEKLVTKISEKLKEMNKTTVTAEQKNKLCTAYDKLTKDQQILDRPPLCQ